LITELYDQKAFITQAT